MGPVLLEAHYVRDSHSEDAAAHSVQLRAPHSNNPVTHLRRAANYRFAGGKCTDAMKRIWGKAKITHGSSIVNWNAESIIAAIDGKDNQFQDPDGSPREPVHAATTSRC